MTNVLAGPWRATRLPRGQPVHRTRLPNGLRVVLLPDQDVPAVGIAVSYDVGYRSETRSGFAHLFEHLMFQGSPNLAAQEHARLVQANGGLFNATTGRDHTCYYEVLPAQALELGLFLEADRLRGVRITEAALATQVSVVAEEINRTIRNRPYGGFPTFQLPPVLFADHANAHDGYGDLTSLAGATLDDCAQFAIDWYTPGNAVLAVCGRFAVDEALGLVHRHFGQLPGSPGQSPTRAAVEVTPGREVVTVDPMAPVPALALGWQLPDPTDPGYLAAMVLAAVLSAGDGSRLKRLLVREQALATQVLAIAGLTGPFDARDPDVFVVNAVCAAGGRPGEVAQRVLAAVAEVAADGVDPVELRRAVRWLHATWYREQDSVGGRARRLASYELLYADPGLTVEVPDRLSAVDGDAVRVAAARLAATAPASLHILPKEAHR